MLRMESAWLLALLLCWCLQVRRVANQTVDWGYFRNATIKTPPYWKFVAGASCDGQRQSPINIATRNVRLDSNLQPIILRSLSLMTNQVQLLKHYSVYMNFNPHWKITFGLNQCLSPVVIHWHWGSDSTKGSEHQINGRTFPMEGHIVSYNCDKYTSFDAAKGSPDGLYVIGFFYQIGKNNDALDKVIAAMDPLIKNEKDSVLMDEINPKLLLPSNLNDYFRYYGSLTTPPCTENVIWTILADFQQISSEQIASFRKLTFPDPETGPLVNNFRPMVDVVGSPDFLNRVVYSSFSGARTLLWNIKLSGLLLLIKYLS